MKTLKELANDAARTVESGYYERVPERHPSGHRSLANSIRGKKGDRRAIVCEIKFASPSAGVIDERYGEVASIARDMETGGAAGLSVLTEPKNFGGSLENLMIARAATNLPLIMKDIVVSKKQIAAADEIGASAVLLIWEIFSAGHAMKGLALEEAISAAREKDLEIIIETHSKEGLIEAAKFDCDIVGINNRDLRTFKTSLETTIELLKDAPQVDRIVMSESGFESAADISRVLERLKSVGGRVPDAYLIGTSIMKTLDVQMKVCEFTGLMRNAEAGIS